MKTILKEAFALFAITLVAVASLAVVYDITKGPIEKAELEARAAAYRTVFADAADFAADTALDDAVKNAKTTLATTGYAAELQDALYVLDASGARVGLVMTVSTYGYGGEISIAVGVKNDKTVSAISILSQSETVGIGSKCTDELFYGQFAGKPATPFTVVKNGAKDDSEIDAIAGATVTSNAVTTGVNFAVSFADIVLGGGAQ